MPISSSAGTTMRSIEECIIPDACARRQGTVGERSERIGALGAGDRMSRQAQCALFYPWLIERISQTFFQEWVGAYIVPTKIDHAEWSCTVCGEYTATWETRSGSYCKYCWSLGRTSPVGPVPKYLQEMIPHDEV